MLRDTTHLVFIYVNFVLLLLIQGNQLCVANPNVNNIVFIIKHANVKFYLFLKIFTKIYMNKKSLRDISKSQKNGFNLGI